MIITKLVGVRMGAIRTNIDYKYRAEAQKMLKKALWARGFTYRDLAVHLTSDGLPHTKENLINKISRGTFSAGFLLQCLAVIEKAPGGRRPVSPNPSLDISAN